MEKKYYINGMTCNGCVNTVTKSLKAHKKISKVSVSLEKGEVTINSSNQISLKSLRDLLPAKYEIDETLNKNIENEKDSKAKIRELWPLILSLIYITIGSYLINHKNPKLDFLMGDFMGLFFLLFAFFKLLDIKGFSQSFRMYDILAKIVPLYGIIYPFIELALGIMFLLKFGIFQALCITLFVLTSTTIGVVQSLVSKESIRCACLGSVLNLPMTQATLIENAIMLTMAFVMLI